MDDLKRAAARRALEFVQSGTTIGLGSGSTMAHFLELLAEEISTGQLRDIQGVPTSDDTASRAAALDLQLTTLAATETLSLAVDGADEVDPELNLIKGLGRALLREKIVAVHARRFVTIVDESKLSPRLGMRAPLPVEIVPFESETHVRWLGEHCSRAELWREADGSPIITDNGNYLARMWFDDGIAAPAALARTLADRPGIVEHGLFLSLATEVVVAAEAGVSVRTRQCAVESGE